ncbi:MAG: ATP-binding protein [Proteobacteria bacterium]|nr:ATP-binding protein [Pseudomonadota bacterium]MBU1418679.1 ATP-binding protein [Pseudomonadota bacterium]MBU1454425.1 ATP-binding protein [Pseudomonadota bacterium]
MIVSVASGKGGTGKTMVSTNMALAIGERLTFLDCDVEEPNAHLFLKPKIEQREQVSTPVPLVDEQKCTFCKKCSDVCRFNAIVVVGTNDMIFKDLCHSCGGCMFVCPENAISETGRELGTIEYGHRDAIRFVQGRLRVGEAMSPPMIRKVRAAAVPHELTIIDAPPGTSCPVIAAMKGVDFVLMVTEPTPFGLHDLQLAVEAVKILDIPAGLVINRCDIGDRKVYEYAERQNLPILLEIPFDRKIAETYSCGQSIVEVMPEWKDKFKGIYRDIELHLEGLRKRVSCEN